MSEDDPLLEALDELTKPARRKVIQDGPVGSGLDGQKIVTVELPPLLEQLDEAIRSSIGGSARGASLPSEGAVLNTGALFTAMLISNQIQDWCRMVGVKPVKNSAKDLRAWYAASLALPHNEGRDEFRTREMRRWAGQIRGLLDPPRERDLPDQCPVCDAKSWWKEGAEYYRPLVIRYRPSGPNMVEEASASCRACESTWGVRELAWQLENRTDVG